jgi:SAM-dependent methyltransferase
MESQVADQYIKKLYEVMLSREPEFEGLNNCMARLEEAGIDGFAILLEEFSKSTEFTERINSIPKENNLETNCEFFFEGLSEETLTKLFEQTARYWRSLASKPEEMYWSVLSSPSYKGILADDVKKEFMKSGMEDVERIKSLCERVGYNLEQCQSYLEYGCGVGRLVYNLQNGISKVNCVDFSSAHLDEAKKNLSATAAASRYHFHHIKNLADLRTLPQHQDIIHSSLVLQHNTPPIIERAAGDLLRLLKSGGLAILHVPIAKACYKFDHNEYLLSAKAGNTMEMHILPKANLYKVAKATGCNIVYSYCDGGCGGDIYSEIIVFQRS